MTLAALITMITTFLAGALEWVGDIVDAIGGNAILATFCFAVPLIGIGVGFLKRLLSTRA